MHPGGPWAQPGIRHVTVDGIPVAVEIVHNGPGTGRTVAWLHGLGSSAIHAFAEVARHPALAGTVSLLINLPGHGLSGGPEGWAYTMEGQAEIVNGILREIVGQPVTLVGHSMGGTVAIACAVRSPEGVGRLIVAEPSLDPHFGPLSAHIANQREERFVCAGYAALVRVTERQARRNDAAAQAFLPSLRLASPVAMHRSATSLLEARSPAFRQQLRELAIPKTVISGDRSAPFEPPLDDGRLMGYVVRDAGHVMMADNPAGFAAAVAVALVDVGKSSN